MSTCQQVKIIGANGQVSLGKECAGKVELTGSILRQWLEMESYFIQANQIRRAHLFV